MRFTKLNYCQYLLSSQINYTITFLAEHSRWMKAAGIAIDEEHYRKVANAKDIDRRTYNARQHQDYLKPKEVLECEKFRIQGTYGMSVTPELVEKDDSGKLILFHFLEDGVGFMDKSREHLYVLDLATRKTDILTPGSFNESLPAWSPDSKNIAFVSKRGQESDRNNNWDLYAIAAQSGAKARQLTTFIGSDSAPDWDSRPVWSPDGKSIAYLQGGSPKLIEYAVHHLAIIPAEGGTPRLLTANLDRNVAKPRFTTDGKSILFLIEDDGNVHLAKIPVTGGKIERFLAGRRDISKFDLGRDGKIALLSSTPQQPNAVFAFNPIFRTSKRSIQVTKSFTKSRVKILTSSTQKK